MDTVEDLFIVNVWNYAKISLGCMVDVKHHISWKVNVQTAYTYDEDLVSLVSFINDRVLSLNALQQVTVGLQYIKSFSLLTQKGTNLQQNYSSLNNVYFSIQISG